MRPTAIAIAMALCLAACSSGDVKATKLTPELVESPAAVANRLPPEDRPVFARYILSRVNAGLGAIQILTPQGGDPATVGEALEITRKVMALEADRDAKMEAATKAQNALPPGHTPAQYNVYVTAYNAAIAEFDAKLAAMQGKASRP